MLFITAGCGGILTAAQGSLSSPGYPSQYPHGVNCTWYISVAEGLIVRLTFSAFALESGSRCQYDYVAVYDSNAATNSTQVGR